MTHDKELVYGIATLIQSILNTSAKYRTDYEKHTARQLAICVIEQSEELYTLIPSANSLFDLASVYTRAFLKGE